MDNYELKLVMEVSENFNLERAVCNHGFFMMAPNKWIPSHKSLIRPLSLPTNNSVVTVSITQPANTNYILLTLLNQHNSQTLILCPQDRKSIRFQVARMLHISPEDETMVHEFHKLHPAAKKSGFARMFRSPTLFEDIVKSVLLCNCSWGRSLEMAQGLCNLQYEVYGEKKGCKRKRWRQEQKPWWWAGHGECKDNFPSPKEIARLDVKILNKYATLGYRAPIILELATNIQNGTLNLDDFHTPIAKDDFEVSSRHQLLRNRLFNIKGFGSFTVANVMMCMGFYQHIPTDTETIKHLKQVHGKTELNGKQIEDTIAEIYDKYAPFQCLAYWMEHIEYYEKKLGKLSELPHSKYCNVTSTNIKVHTFVNEE